MVSLSSRPLATFILRHRDTGATLAILHDGGDYHYSETVGTLAALDEALNQHPGFDLLVLSTPDTIRADLTRRKKPASTPERKALGQLGRLDRLATTRKEESQ